MFVCEFLCVFVLGAVGGGILGMEWSMDGWVFCFLGQWDGGVSFGG